MSKPETLILGLGNPLRGDDGVGPAVVAALRPAGLPVHVQLQDAGAPGLELLLLWEGFEHVIIVDAAEMQLPAGAWRCFSIKGPGALEGPGACSAEVTQHAIGGTLHSVGLGEALALAAALERLPPRLTVVGVQPAAIDWDMALSPAVTAALPAVCQAIIDLVTP